MCYLTTIQLQPGTEAAVRQSVPAGIDLGELRYSELSVPGTISLPVTHGGCSCRLVHAGAQSPKEKLGAKYAKKGWSVTKIERALRDQEASSRRAATARAFGGWLTQLAAAGHTIRLFIHRDSAPLDKTHDHGVVSCDLLESLSTKLPDEGWVTLAAAT